MIKAATFLKASATILTTCILAACGGESSSSSNDTYTMTLTAPAMGAVEGKSVYTLNIKDTDGTAVANASPKMMPLMNMVSGMQHSAPGSGCTNTDSKGDAQCTVYFLMPSMMNTVKMGDWKLSFSLENDDQEAISFPAVVKMSMNGPAKVVLVGDSNDQISYTTNMSNTKKTENRSYYIFNNGITAIDNTHSVEFFVAAKESMMNFPTLASDIVLSEGTNNEITVSNISISVSSDMNATSDNWVDATPSQDGIWNASAIAGYTDKLYVKLSVNGEVKTNNSEPYAIFTAAPDM